MATPLRPASAGLAAGIAILLLSGAGSRAEGQIISPGKLSNAHAAISGIRNCTQCHELRKPGISPELCLSCHTPLAGRINAGQGFHASVTEENCASCHKEHLGPDFDVVRLDTLSFDHGRTGYRLDGEHVAVGCRSCHVPRHVVDPVVTAFKTEHEALARTYLGLSSTCATCHEEDQPHGDQFDGRACADCHDTGGWDAADAFDHDRTAFGLTGEHVDVACADCHAADPQPGRGGGGKVRYVGIPHAGCNDCHEDQHDGAMPGACAGCHTTRGWRDLDERRLERSFNHRSTGFPLEGLHASAPCAACHDAAFAASRPGIHLTFSHDAAGRSFPPPEAGSCLSCHEDEHRGAMSTECARCHTPGGWTQVEARLLEAAFDHASTGFTLDGRHAAASCAACHEAGGTSVAGVRITFVSGTEGRAFAEPEGDFGTCGTCHLDPHEGVFESMEAGPDCRGCHSATGWAPTSFDVARHNQSSRFPLEGAHVVVACADCHQSAPAGDLVFRFESGGCLGCHGDGNPHGDQFAGRDCADCHDTRSFGIDDFDHGTTAFPLDGAHQTATCAACHAAVPGTDGVERVRYRPLGTSCRDCHGGGS